jgi:hypothetical protein
LPKPNRPLSTTCIFFGYELKLTIHHFGFGRGGFAKNQPCHSKGGKAFSRKDPYMPTIKIDNKDYDTDTLSTEAKQQLQMLSITESEINRLQAQLAIAQTARISYANALKAALPAIGGSDTIKL